MKNYLKCLQYRNLVRYSGAEHYKSCRALLSGVTKDSQRLFKHASQCATQKHCRYN